MTEPYVEHWGCEWNDCGIQTYSLNYMMTVRDSASAACGCPCTVSQKRDCRIEYCYFPDFGFFPKCRCYAVLKVDCNNSCPN